MCWPYPPQPTDACFRLETPFSDIGRPSPGLPKKAAESWWALWLLPDRRLISFPCSHTTPRICGYPWPTSTNCFRFGRAKLSAPRLDSQTCCEPGPRLLVPSPSELLTWGPRLEGHTREGVHRPKRYPPSISPEPSLASIGSSAAFRLFFFLQQSPVACSVEVSAVSANMVV